MAARAGRRRLDWAGFYWAGLGWAAQEAHGGRETPLHPDPPLAGQREVPQPADCPLSTTVSPLRHITPVGTQLCDGHPLSWPSIPCPGF